MKNAIMYIYFQYFDFFKCTRLHSIFVDFLKIISHCRKRESVARRSFPPRQVHAKSDQDSETEQEPSKTLKVNQHGLHVLGNSVVSQTQLEINQAIPSRTSDRKAKCLFGANLSWGQSNALFCLVICPQNIPVEKHRDLPLRKTICFSAAPFSLSSEQIKELESLEDPVINAYILGLSKNSLQKLWHYF